MFFYAIDVAVAAGEFAAVAHAAMHLVAQRRHAVITGKLVAVNDARQIHIIPQRLCQCGLRAIGDDVRAHLSAALHHAEHDGFAACAASGFSFHAARAEV